MLIIRDFAPMFSNVLYIRYNLFSDIIISYIAASMHFNTEKIRALRNAKSYIFSYYFITFFTISIFSIVPTLALPYALNYKQFLPIFLTLIAFIISIYLTTYSKIADTLEENAINKIHLKKNKLETSYNEQIDKKLQQLLTLRHDMKNHLLLIDSFANECNIEKIHSYIRQICRELQQTQIITSSSSALSSLLNTKKLICDENMITFSTILDFGEIYIDDFTIITIISNLLDNAITAAAKVADGYIKLTIEQTGSYLSINCNNNHCEKIEKKEGSFISSKPSVNFQPDSTHGLGIKIFTGTVKKHGGSVDILYDANTFSVNILIPNYA